MAKRADIQKLVDLVERLRGPDGCPWDREQTRETLKPMLIEEAYEVLDALDSHDPKELREELGDLLFQVLFHARIADEKGEFHLADVIDRLHEKMVRRHPHVFGNADLKTAEDVLRNWEDIKADEKGTRSSSSPDSTQSILDGLPSRLPALHQAYQMTAKAARVGFDWSRLEDILLKLQEEAEELLEARRNSAGGGACRGSRRSLVRRRQRRPLPWRRPRNRAAAEQREVQPEIPICGITNKESGPRAEKCHACRNGCPVGRSEAEEGGARS